MSNLADGQEILVVDGDESVRRGLEQLLRSANLVPTDTGDPERALGLVETKFFAVALIDLDTPHAGFGVALIAELHRRSPATTVILMAGRKTFDGATAAFRAGAADVIVKTPDQVDYLRDRVVRAAASHRLEIDRSRLLAETSELHEDLIKILLDTFKRMLDLEEKLGAHAVPVEDSTSVLVVDDDGDRQAALLEAISIREGFTLRSVATGGEALDLVSRERFQIVMVRDALPDLPGSMVVRTTKAQQPEAIALLYRAPDGRTAGKIDVIEGSRAIPFMADFTKPQQILSRLDELRDAALATSRERRYLAAFRQKHFELLRRIAETRQRLGQSGADLAMGRP